MRPLSENLPKRVATAAEFQRVSTLLDTLLQTAPIGFCFVDRDLRYVRINERLAAINGISVEAHLGRHVSEIVPSLAETIRDVANRILATGQAVLNHEFSGETPAAPGVTRFWSESWYPVPDGSGEVLGFGAIVEEITTRKLADEQLRAAHDSFRQLVEHSPFGIYAVDADFRLAQVSGGAQKVFENVRPLIGRDFAEVLGIVWPEPFASEAIAIFRQVLKSGEPYHAPSTIEKRHDTAAVESYDWKVERVTLPDGRPGVVCHFYDLTERHAYVAMLRQSEERYRNLFESLMEGCCLVETIYDAEGGAIDCRLLETNQAFELQSGLSGVKGRTIREVIPEIESSWIEAVAKVVETGEPVRFEMAAAALNRWFDVQAFRVNEFGSKKVAVVFNDITEQRRSERALRESEERARLAAEATGVGIWEWHLPTGTLRWDAQLFRIYGIDPTPDGCVQYTDWSGAVLPEDLPESERILEDTVRRRGQTRSEFRIRRRYDGQVRHIESVETVRPNAQGETEWVVGTNLDVTARRDAERKLHQLAADLSESHRRKDEFLATLAHELRNPLAPLRTGLDVMRMSPSGNPAVDKARAMMERQLGHMVRLVDDLMDVARISRGKIELKVTRVQAHAILDHAVEASRPFIEAGGHALVVDAVHAVSGSAWVNGDLTRLAQVVGNLLNNAAKYTPEGGRIELAARVEAGALVISVTDNGAGISAEMLPNVFDLFAQVDRTLDRAQGGLGIGLSVVRSLVELHGGTVTAASAGIGLGSTFTTRLPLASTAEESVANEPSTHRLPSSLRVLVVDDNVDAAEMLSAMLELTGHEARAVHDGPAALTVARDIRPDVVFLDIGLPGMNGHEVARQFRADAAFAGIVLVALTGWGSDDDKRKSREAGFDHHVTKPLDFKRVQEIFAGINDR